MVSDSITSKDVFYLQARGHTGNSLLWWREGRHGYTNDIRKAHVFTRDEAFAQHRCRPDTDFPWRKEYIDAHVQLHVVVDDIGHEDEQAFVSTAPESTDWQRIARERTADVRKADEKIERLQRELAHWKDCHSVTADMLAAARSSHEPMQTASEDPSCLSRAMFLRRYMLRQGIEFARTEEEKQLFDIVLFLEKLAAHEPPDALTYCNCNVGRCSGGPINRCVFKFCDQRERASQPPCGADPSCILCGQRFSKHAPRHATQMFDPQGYVLACPTMIVFHDGVDPGPGPTKQAALCPHGYRLADLKDGTSSCEPCSELGERDDV